MADFLAVAELSEQAEGIYRLEHQQLRALIGALPVAEYLSCGLLIDQPS
jgi:hypothetical protein